MAPVVEEAIVPLEQVMLDDIFNAHFIRPVDDNLVEAPLPRNEEELVDLDDLDREFNEMMERADAAGLNIRAEEEAPRPALEPLVVGGAGEGPIMHFGPLGPMDLGEMRARLAQDRVRQHFDRGGRRRAGRVVRDGDAEIPADAVEEPALPQAVQGLRKAAPVKKAVVKKHAYPEEGVMFRGRKFARSLTMSEQMYYSDYGYASMIGKCPDLEFKEQEKPIDDTEECIILMSELADHFAIDECNRTIDNFDLKTHFKEYQVSYKKYLKTVSGFKRNKHG